MLNEKQPPLANIFNFNVHFTDDWVDESFLRYSFNDDSVILYSLLIHMLFLQWSTTKIRTPQI